jgi:hypothetical protein
MLQRPDRGERAHLNVEPLVKGLTCRANLCAGTGHATLGRHDGE